MARRRTLAICAGAAVLAVVSGSFALGRVTERRQPLVSAALPTVNGIGLAEKSELILAANMRRGLSPQVELDPAERSQAIALARRAYAAEPLSITAVRNLALIASADGNTETARRLMRDAVRLSRRDLSVNGWLIRDYGERGEVPAALAAYDHALRTSSAGQEVLMPAMFNALASPALVEPLIGLLRAEPPWAAPFWREAPKYPPALVNVAKIRVALATEGMHGDDNRDLALLRALTAEHEFAAAETLFDAVADSPLAPQELLRNTEFARPARFEPFDWRLFFETLISAEIVPLDGVMRIDSFADGSGLVAHQLVALVPGAYTLSIEARDWDALDAGALVANLRCAEEGGGPKSGPIPISQPNFTARLTVPGEGCTYFWFELHARAQPQRRDNTVVLDSVRLRRGGPTDRR